MNANTEIADRDLMIDRLKQKLVAALERVAELSAENRKLRGSRGVTPVANSNGKML